MEKDRAAARMLLPEMDERARTGGGKEFTKARSAAALRGRGIVPITLPGPALIEAANDNWRA